MKHRLFSILISTSFALTVACGGCGQNNKAADTGTADDGETPDDGTPFDMNRKDVADMPAPTDVGDDAIIGSRTLTDPQDGVSPTGATEIETTLQAEARAGSYTVEPDFEGIWSHCKMGDFKLYNERIEVCISSVVSNRYEMFNGGGLVDVRTVGNPAEDVFDLYAPGAGYNTLHAETVEVIRDGSDGGPAVVRAVGTDMPAAYFVGVAGEQLFSPNGLDMVVEYRLGPTDDFVEAAVFLTNNTGGPVQLFDGGLIAFGDRATIFRPGDGFASTSGPFDWLAAAGEGHSFAWVFPDAALRSLAGSFGDPPWEILQAPEAVVLQDGDQLSHFARMVIGDGSLGEVISRARELAGEQARPARVITVTDEAGAPVAGRQVTVLSGEEPISGGFTDGSGQLTVFHDNGQVAYEISGVAGQQGTEVNRTVGGNDAEIALSVPATGRLAVEPSVAGVETIASVRVRGPGSTDFVAWSGGSPVELAPGAWTVEVGKGPEYDYVIQEITVTAGETATVTADLTRVVDTTDWIAADFHQHMEPSSDSRVRVEGRILDNVAEGVEFVVPTDHDVATDLVPYIEELGLTGILGTVPGTELSPALAHTNIYPVPYDAAKPGRGTISLAEVTGGEPRRRTVPDLIALARALPTDPVIQINHPRDSSGLFDYVGFDPEVGPQAVNNRWWTTDFDAFETLNGDACLEFLDLAGLWNAGLTPTPIGSSDSHGVWGQVGEYRTYLYLPGLDVGDVTGAAVRDAVKSGAVVVASSAFMEFTDGTIPGSTIDGSAGSVELGLRVRSANWSAVDQLQVVENGVITQTIPVSPTSDVLDFEGTVTLTPTVDSWFVIVASGPPASGEYRPSGKRTIAYHTPIRIDVDGGGFQAPGPGPLPLTDIAVCQ